MLKQWVTYFVFFQKAVPTKDFVNLRQKRYFSAKRIRRGVSDLRKVPPILKPIALLTISILIATATGVANGASYRQPSTGSSSTIEPSTSEVTTTSTTSAENQMTPESSSVYENNQSSAPSSTQRDQQTIRESSVSDSSNENQTVPSSGQAEQTVPSQEQNNVPAQQQKQPASTPETREAQ
ncbi:hypothetical protein I588_02918 [Enterococcus pallens ATCC BAA-351]|uniref:Uncharacterized protein n=1 Tax=Enterococcus pallens ATCC BAA-351 TaxID=1158607 RepID=R2S473_9ENTE|nr:hypothetical protein UAU_04570 [Enterococcus pallens ATCC BAA-351]EOU17930.1 hypothetical protein I588_02918 [Enterococcus pallens ATCC BAA-351]OJG82447.1 hypothetical protein RV10_GL000268 [Enterococcus pallens]